MVWVHNDPPYFPIFVVEHESHTQWLAYAFIRRGGTQIGRWNGDMQPSGSPFSDRILSPETHCFKPFPTPETPLGFFEKILHFKTNFCQFLAPETEIFAKICSRDPSFKPKKISSGGPIFESPGGTYLPKFLTTTSPGELLP